MAKKTCLATISILIKDRHAQSPDVNQLLTDHGNLIIARFGLNLANHCTEHCNAIISVVVNGPSKEITDLAKKIDKVYGVVAKTNVLSK